MQLKPYTYTKESVLANWRKLKKRQNPLPYMEAIPYKTKGSKYGTCGIRIDGNAKFIDAVLSNLTDLIEGESANTRLNISRSQVAPLDGHDFTNGLINDGEVCYIRLCERGHEAKIYNAITKAFTTNSNSNSNSKE